MHQRLTALRANWMKGAWLAALVALALLSGAPTLAGPLSGAGETAKTGEPGDAPECIVVYYLHGAVRCVTCLEIEQLSREVIFDQFLGELREGKVEWHSVNYETPHNQHFSDDFDLPHPSLVLARERAGVVVAHRRLDKVWELVEDPMKLKEFVGAETSTFIAGRPSNPRHNAGS